MGYLDALSQAGLSYDPNAPNPPPTAGPADQSSLSQVYANANAAGIQIPGQPNMSVQPPPPPPQNASVPQPMTARLPPQGSSPMPIGADEPPSTSTDQQAAQFKKLGYPTAPSNVEPNVVRATPKPATPKPAQPAPDTTPAPLGKSTGGAGGAAPPTGYTDSEGNFHYTGKDPQQVANEARMDALGETSWAQQQQSWAQAEAARQKSTLLAAQQQDIAQKAGERDAEYRRQQEKIEQLSRDQAQKKIDPDRFYKNQSTGQSIMWTLAAMASGAAAGWNHQTGNVALEAMDKRVSNDIAAQKEEIESGKTRIEDAKGILGETYRRYGNMEQAEQAARIISLQKTDEDAAQLQATTGSDTAAARIGEVRASLQADIAKQKADLAARSAASGYAQQQAVVKRTQTILDKAAASGQDISTADARRQAEAETVGSGGPGSGAYKKTVPQKAAPGAPQMDRQMRATDEAIAGVDKMIKMVSAGGQTSPARTAEGKSIHASTVDNLALSTTGRAPTDAQLKLAKDALPEDPNSYQWTGSDLARLKATRQTLVERQKQLKQARMMGGGSGETEAEPEPQANNE